jgi:UV DNA damage endonuclease
MILRFVRLLSPHVAPRAPVAHISTMAKRKRSTGAAAVSAVFTTDLPRSRRSITGTQSREAAKQAKPPSRQPSRGVQTTATNPNINPDILDGVSALRASPDSGEDVGGAPGIPSVKPRVRKASRAAQQVTDAGTSKATLGVTSATTELNSAPAAGGVEHGHDGQIGGTTIGGSTATNNGGHDELGLSAETTAADPPDQEPGSKKRKKAPAKHVKVDSAEGIDYTSNVSEANVTRETTSGKAATEVDVGALIDPEDEEGPKAGDEEEEVIKEALSRAPPVNSDYLPLPWKGRLGYVRWPYICSSASKMS